MSKFEASDYSRFRVLYPKALFEKLGSYCISQSAQRPLRVVDLGCGTGFSTASFLEYFPNSIVTMVEPDAAMLAHARERFGDSPAFRYVNASSESYEFGDPVDLVLIGSAWHWMDRPQLLKKFEDARVGAVFIFEYQFPKAKQQTELNEWIRREFNLRWRTSVQVPRGNLTELTQGLRDSSFYSEVSRTYLPNDTDFDLDAFFGMLISQSRFLAFEETLLVGERDAYRQSVHSELSKFWGLQKQIPFFLPYEGFCFQSRRI